MFRLACLALLLVAGPVMAQPQPTGPASVISSGDETRDFVLPPQRTLRRSDQTHAPTPLTVPGARVILTTQLAEALRSPTPPLLLDVLMDVPHASIPGAAWLQRAGSSGTSLDDDIQPRIAEAVLRLAGGDRNRAIVVFCLSELCWMSYNVALRLAHAGFTNVLWYRGGTAAWKRGGLPEEPPRAVPW